MRTSMSSASGCVNVSNMRTAGPPGFTKVVVIWNGPPLSAYSRAEQTWIEGVEYFDIERDGQMREAAEAERRALVQKALKMKPPKRGGGEGQERRRRGWHCDDVEDTWNE